MPVSIASHRFILFGSYSAIFGVILYSLLGSIVSSSINVYVLDAVVAISVSSTILGLLALIVGGVIWAWKASMVWLLLSTIVVGTIGLLAAEFGDLNIHGPADILMFVLLAVVAIGGLFGLVSIIRFASSFWSKKAETNRDNLGD
jgi:hypothetical protein